MKRNEMAFLHKMLGVATLLGEHKPCQLLIAGLGINPFKVSLDFKTSFQISCERPHHNMIEFLTNFEFDYIDGGKKFDLQRQISKKNDKDKNSGIHYAALRDIPKNFETLKEINSQMLGQFNGRNLFPFECSRNLAITKSGDKFRREELRKTLFENKEKVVENTGRVREGFGYLETEFVYAIICRDVQSEPEKTLVFEQLDRLNKLQKDDDTNKREQKASLIQKRRRLKTLKTMKNNMNSNEGEFTETIEEIIIMGGGESEDFDDQEEEEVEMKGDKGKINIYNDQVVDVETKKNENEPLLGLVQHKWKVFNGKVFKVKWVQLLDHTEKDREYYRHCFLVGLNQEVMPEIANYMNLLIYNKKKGFPENFVIDKKNDFENFRDSHKQKMVLYLLKHEIDLEDFKRRGIIEQYFPFHDFRKMNYINTSWGKEKYMAIIDNLLPYSTNLSRLNPFNSLNFYHGSEVALYMGFNSVYTSWLLLMGFFGLLCFVCCIALNLNYDNGLLPFYAAIVSIIITLAQQFWERRQNEFSYLWNTIDYKENEQPRRNFIGHFTIDKLKRKIIVQNNWPASSRRYVSDVLMLITGVGLIIANFVMFFFINLQISNKKNNGKISDLEATYLSLISGAGNASVVFILDQVYRFLLVRVVNWENHRYQSDQIMSKVPKLFFFNFAMNYINLFFYAFYLRDFVVLQSNFISMFITKNLLHFGLMNLLPWAMYVFNKFLLMRRFKRERSKRKKAFLDNLSKNKSDEIVFDSLSKSQQEEAIGMESELLLWEMVEISIIQPLPVPMEDIWLNYMLQFGFIAFFSITFPLAPLIGFIFNLIDMNFVFFSFSRVFKRETIIELDSIGVWNDIIHAMTIASLIVNVALFVWCSKSFYNLLGTEISMYHLLVALVIYEHVVFVIKFFLSIIIKSKPLWLRNKLKFQKIKRQMYKESTSQKLINQKMISAIVKSKSKVKQMIPKIGLNNLMNIITVNQSKNDIPNIISDHAREHKERIQSIDDASEILENENEKDPEIHNLDLEDEEDAEEELLTGLLRKDSVGFINKVASLDLKGVLGRNINKIKKFEPKNDFSAKDELEENLLIDEEKDN